LKSWIVAQNFPCFIEPEFSLPYSQPTVAGPSPAPLESLPHSHTLVC
jgi:hypothetical protein